MRSTSEVPRNNRAYRSRLVPEFLQELDDLPHVHRLLGSSAQVSALRRVVLHGGDMGDGDIAHVHERESQVKDTREAAVNYGLHNLHALVDALHHRWPNNNERVDDNQLDVRVFLVPLPCRALRLGLGEVVRHPLGRAGRVPVVLVEFFLAAAMVGDGRDRARHNHLLDGPSLCASGEEGERPVDGGVDNVFLRITAIIQRVRRRAVDRKLASHQGVVKGTRLVQVCATNFESK